LTIVFIIDWQDVVYQIYDINEPLSNLFNSELIIFKAIKKIEIKVPNSSALGRWGVPIK